MTPAPHRPEPGTPAYEERDVSLRPIVVAAVALTVVLVATVVLMWFLDRALFGREAARSAPASPLAGTYANVEPPAPRLQTAPRVDLEQLRAREQSLLDGYGWADREAGRVRIPVGRAMELLAEEGR